jgi:hypothetical protein
MHAGLVLVRAAWSAVLHITACCPLQVPAPVLMRTA